MNAPMNPSILARPSSGQLNIQQLNDLKTLLRRGLNTWEDAPAWLLSLSDQVDAETTTCSMGLPASCGGALCAPAEHHPLCGLNQSPSQASEAHDVCPNCDGSGTVLERSDNSPDAHEVSVTCPHCNGSGALADAYRGAVDLLKIATANYHQALPFMVKAKELSSKPVLYVSPKQFLGVIDGSAQGFKDLGEGFGGYLPVRSSPSGMFTKPLYTDPQQSAVEFVLRQALQQIADWSSHTAEFSVDYGSNGVRDLYRRIAREALASTPALNPNADQALTK